MLRNPNFSHKPQLCLRILCLYCPFCYKSSIYIHFPIALVTFQHLYSNRRNVPSIRHSLTLLLSFRWFNLSLLLLPVIVAWFVVILPSTLNSIKLSAIPFLMSFYKSFNFGHYLWFRFFFGSLNACIVMFYFDFFYHLRFVDRFHIIFSNAENPSSEWNV